MKHNIVSLDNKVVGEVNLNDDLFGQQDRIDLIAKVVRWQLAKKRPISRATKGISDIRGTNAKPFSQKGTGRARAGSSRDSQHRGGAIIFGPSRRSFGFKLPKKVRALGLKVAFSVKKNRGDFVVIDSLELKEYKTSVLSNKLSSFDAKSLVIIGSDVSDQFKKAARNIPNVDLLDQVGANVYDLVRHDKVLITKDALEKLEKRLVA